MRNGRKSREGLEKFGKMRRRRRRGEAPCRDQWSSFFQELSQ
jgi:hypothetical protein